MILVSAFEPFDIDPENSSQLILESYLATQPKGVIGVVLPVSFARVWTVLKREIERWRPSAILSLGQADGRTQITPELVGLNLCHARIADADGAEPKETAVGVGPLALKSRVSIGPLVDALGARGLPVEMSLSAGAYVCNALTYQLYQWSEMTKNPALFVHFPLVKGQRLGSGRESVRPTERLKQEDGVKAVEFLVEYLAREAGGET